LRVDREGEIRIMSLRDRRIVSSMTVQARVEADKRKSEGKDPITGKKEGATTAPCPRCEIRQPTPPSGGGKGGGGKGGEAA
jgi:hypothetical protein